MTTQHQNIKRLISQFHLIFVTKQAKDDVNGRLIDKDKINVCFFNQSKDIA
jgi:hypothetical protein